MSNPTGQALQRRLGTADAVVIGLGSMIGAGVFAAFAPAAQAAGSWLLLGLLIAALIAYCNATASAQLAAAYPTSGGTYLYGRERLGPWWGFTAGWGFVVGKTASAAAMSLTFASYALPGPVWAQRAVAIAGVWSLTALNYRGIAKTAKMTRILVAASLAALTIVVIGIVVGGGAEPARIREGLGDASVYGILQSAGMLFFAFAGYARIATLGEEVRDPQQTIPRAIPLALSITVVVYAVVGVAVLAAAGPQALATATAPLTEAVTAAGASSLAPVVRIGGAIAALGALLALIAGIGRTSLAMARNRDLPSWLASVHPRFHIPHHAELTVAAVVTVLLVVGDLRGAIGFSSFGVLIYYGIANTAAITQPSSDRRWPRWLNVLGIIGCITLITTLPRQSVITGLAVFAIGLGGRALVLRLRGRSAPAAD